MRRAISLALLALLGFLTPVGAAGLIVIHEADFWRQPGPPPHRTVPPTHRHPPRHHWAPLEVNYLKGNVEINNQIATTKIEEEFYNPNSRQLESTFLFPLPKGAVIDKFTMDINGQQVQAELLPADKARNIYETIVRKMRDPALLEYAGQGLFKVRIFPIEPHSKKLITLAYTQLLKSDSGLADYVFPLNTQKYSAKPVRSVSLSIDLNTRQPLKSIYSPSHEVDIHRHGENQAKIGFEAAHVSPDTDFQLMFSQEKSPLSLNLLTHKSGNENGYFLLLASPGETSKRANIIAKDVVFVLDTSGSMSGAKLKQAKNALLFCVENLNAKDQFEILRFSTEVEPLFDQLTKANSGNRQKARKFLNDLNSVGGTAIDGALQKALSLRPKDSNRPYVVVFLTDGRPTVGNTDINHIVSGITKNKEALTRIFCFGLGTDVNTHLLDRITEQTRSFSQYVLPEEDIEIKVSNFFTKIKEPVLANLKLEMPDNVRATKMYPSPLPDLFNGQQLVVAGRYSGHGKGSIVIKGSMAGHQDVFEYNVKFPKQSSEHEFLPRLWATRRVGFLLDEIRLRGENKELVDEATQLARTHGIVTPYTAYLIIEDEKHRGVAQTNRLFGRRLNEAGVQEALSQSYRRFREEKSGDAAVGGARSLSRLKSAPATSGSLNLANQDALRSQQLYAPATPAPKGSPSAITRSPNVRTGPTTAQRDAYLAGNLSAKPRLDLAKKLSEQGQFVSGRTFYKKDNQWVDQQVLAMKDASVKRIKFDSNDYYTFISKNPKAQPWLALGRNVKFVYEGQIIEIYDNEK